jgi:hypothetical protein
MLFIYDKRKGTISPTKETDFKSHEIMERKDLEKWVIDHPGILGERLLVITNEYDKFDKTKDRVDLLCLDANGKLVIVELKRGVGSKTAELQAIKYAAYCSTLTMDDLVSLRKKLISKGSKMPTDEEVKKEISNFITNDEFEELDDKPRIIIVATDFRPEITATVLWLRKFGIDMSCVKFAPYRISENEIAVVSAILIPLPEAEEYIVKSEKKESIDKPLTRTKQEYLNFYKELAQALRLRIPEISLPEPKPIAYYQIPTGISKVHYEWIFWGRPRSDFGVQLHFEKTDREANVKLLNELKKYRDEIESQTKWKVRVESKWGPNNNWASLSLDKEEGKMTEDLKIWAVNTMEKLIRIIQPKLEKFAG